ncbi:MAG: DUF6483 family protein [Tissierellia bacterium]|nr:DUF6483 family protein [Tissierellia bacterium]
MLKNDRSKVEINQRLKFLTKILSLSEEKPIYEKYDKVFQFLEDGRINDGENLIFDFLDEGGPDILRVAISFYDRLNTYSDFELKELNFSRKEIKDGLDDILNIYGLKLS